MFFGETHTDDIKHWGVDSICVLAGVQLLRDRLRQPPRVCEIARPEVGHAGEIKSPTCTWRDRDPDEKDGRLQMRQCSGGAGNATGPGCNHSQIWIGRSDDHCTRSGKQTYMTAPKLWQPSEPSSCQKDVLNPTGEAHFDAWSRPQPRGISQPSTHDPLPTAPAACSNARGESTS